MRSNAVNENCSLTGPLLCVSIVCHTDKLLDLFEFEVIGNLLVKTVTSLMTDPQRRVRLETVNQLPLLARTLVGHCRCSP